MGLLWFRWPWGRERGGVGGSVCGFSRGHGARSRRLLIVFREATLFVLAP